MRIQEELQRAFSMYLQFQGKFIFIHFQIVFYYFIL